MDENKLRMMAIVINYLRDEFRAGYLDSENAEGLEVAIHCLENIYDVNRFKEEVPKLTDLCTTFYTGGTSGVKIPTEAEKAEAERLKVEGNLSMRSDKFDEAIAYYTRAIQYNPNNAVYYCNRAAAFSKKEEHEYAIKDCKIAINLDPNYSKAYGRLGLAYCGLELYEFALENYQKAHDLEPDNEGYKRNLELAQRKVSQMCTCESESEAQRPGPFFVRIPEDVRDEINFHSQQNNPQLDYNTIFGNPELLNIAQQMLSEPAVQSMMNSILNQDGSNSMQALLQAGQTMARQMQEENPVFFDRLRQSLSTPGNPQPPNNQPNGNPDQGGNKQQ